MAAVVVAAAAVAAVVAVAAAAAVVAVAVQQRWQSFVVAAFRSFIRLYTSERKKYEGTACL